MLMLISTKRSTCPLAESMVPNFQLLIKNKLEIMMTSIELWKRWFIFFLFFFFLSSINIFLNSVVYEIYYSISQNFSHTYSYAQPTFTCFKSTMETRVEHHQFIFISTSDLRPATLLKKRLSHWCFPVNFAKFLRTTFLQDISRHLLLNLLLLLRIFLFSDVLKKYRSFFCK